MILLDGKKYRDELLEEYKKQIESENLKIRLDIILIGNDDASLVYVNNKLKYASLVGIDTKLHHLEDGTNEEEVIELIEKLNNDVNTTGIILQSPTPNLDFKRVANHISPSKDVDGLANENIIGLYHNRSCILPCTVKGIIMLLKHYDIEILGRDVCIIGRGEIVGKPLSLAISNLGATVTVCDQYTKDLSLHTRVADIIISAVGKKDLITEDMVKDGFIGVDVGITKVDGKLSGDFDFEGTSRHASFMTPVPGGIGPMTIAMIISNLIDLKKGNV